MEGQHIETGRGGGVGELVGQGPSQRLVEADWEGRKVRDPTPVWWGRLTRGDAEAARQ